MNKLITDKEIREVARLIVDSKLVNYNLNVRRVS